MRATTMMAIAASFGVTLGAPSGFAHATTRDPASINALVDRKRNDHPLLTTQNDELKNSIVLNVWFSSSYPKAITKRSLHKDDNT
jgi:hypothetical protein